MGQRRISVKMLTAYVVSSLFPAAKPLHHHGKECLRLRVDVVAVDGEFNRSSWLYGEHNRL